MLVLAVLLILMITLFITFVRRIGMDETAYDQGSRVDTQVPTIYNTSSLSKEKEVVLPVRITGKKNELIKRTDSNTNNMNCDRFLFSGKYSQTGRIRTKQKVIIFKGDDLYEEIKK